MKTGQIVRELREQHHMTQSELAERLGYTDKSTVAKIEQGKVNLKASRLAAMAEVFSVSPAYLLGSQDVYDIPGIEPMPLMRKIPLIGAIACGSPILAEQNVEQYVDLGDLTKADFALRCRGDSMIGAGIRDGDIVFIRRQEDVDDGQVAAVLIGEEATLKRVYHTPSGVILQPENPNYRPIVCNDDTAVSVRILGIAVAWLGTLC